MIEMCCFTKYSHLKFSLICFLMNWILIYLLLYFFFVTNIPMFIQFFYFISIYMLFDFLEKWKHKKCTLDEVYKGAVIFLDAAIMEPATQVAGVEVIFDMDGLSLQQTWQFSPPFAKRIVDWLQVRTDSCLRIFVNFIKT